MYFVCQFLYTGREVLCIRIPVSQTCLLVVPGTEPTVIHDDAFNAQFLGFLGHYSNFPFVRGVAQGIPSIKHNRLHPIFPKATANGFVYEIPQFLLRFLLPLFRVDQNGFRSFEELIFSKLPHKHIRVYATDDMY